ncbi:MULTISPECIES: nucleoid-associated protein YejK [Halomonadaceae]|uniref:nucleoid-associated protein YejK n=1 Tax=Halomonadaceae TaxID=28256 RepID=UPI00159AC355|nr:MULTISPECIES: nucleoid-associated protein YejK [Halomonas]QJQ95114.1 nucleoid-associated protein YejK [Halomonas sp. PA5]
MPILNSIVHQIDKPTPDRPATLQRAGQAHDATPSMADLLASFNDSFHAKPKTWGHFSHATGSRAFEMALARYLDDEGDFTTFTLEVVEKLKALIDVHLPVGGPVLFVHYQQGDTQYLSFSLLHHRQGFGIDASLKVAAVQQLNLSQLMLAARIDLNQWRGGKSQQYISFIKDRGGKKLADDFRELLGCEEGVDSSGETRTLLKAFSDYVESEDLSEEQSREKTDTLIDYASNQARRGEPITLDELSELVDEQQPKAFYDYIRQQDYGLSPEIPADRRTLNQFRRFTGRSAGVSISFDSHLLGSGIEYDSQHDRLIIKQVPPQLRDQIKRREGS